jgi:hypothetical protein
VPAPKKRAARPRKRSKPPLINDELAIEIAHKAIAHISTAVRDRVQNLLDENEDLAEAVNALHARVEALEARQGIFPTRVQATFCDCPNCRLRWN